MVVVSDVCPLYTHTLLSNEFALKWLNFYLKSVKFLFLFSILYMYLCLRLLVSFQVSDLISESLNAVNPSDSI